LNTYTARQQINRIPKSTNEYNVLKKVKWKPLQHYYKKRISCLCYEIFHKLSPEPLHSWLNKSTQRRSLRNCDQVDIPKFSKVSFKKSFMYRAAVTWNQLPKTCKEKTSLASFKNQLEKENGTVNISYCEGAMRSNFLNDFVYY